MCIRDRIIAANQIPNRKFDSKSNRISKLRRSLLEMWSWQGAIQIHIDHYLYLNLWELHLIATFFHVLVPLVLFCNLIFQIKVSQLLYATESTQRGRRDRSVAWQSDVTWHHDHRAVIQRRADSRTFQLGVSVSVRPAGTQGWERVSVTVSQLPKLCVKIRILMHGIFNFYFVGAFF